ncbi:hypothetical protein COBT_000167 [Conglomerata obtusa]
MNHLDKDNIKEYIHSIILQHKTGTFNTTQTLSSLITILKQHNEYNTHVSLDYFKKKGMKECLGKFLELIDMSDDKVRFLCDTKVCCFIAKIIAEYCRKEIDEDENEFFDENFYTKENKLSNKNYNKVKNENLISIESCNDNENCFDMQNDTFVDKITNKNNENNDSFVSACYNYLDEDDDGIIKRRRSKTNKENFYYKDTNLNLQGTTEKYDDKNENMRETEEIKSSLNTGTNFEDHKHFTNTDTNIEVYKSERKNFRSDMINLQKHNLIDYIDDDCINLYLNVLINIFNDNSAIFLLEILHQIGMFELFYILATEKMCILFNNIYKNKLFFIYIEKEFEKEKVNNINGTIQEVQRKFFENQIVIKQKRYIDNKPLATNYIKVNEKIYSTILNEFLEKNLCFFIIENGIKNLTNVLNFYFSCIDNYPSSSLLNYLYVDDVINEIHTQIIKDETIEALKLYNNLLINVKKMQNNEIIIAKLILNVEFNRKLFKITDSKKRDVVIYSFLIINNILDITTNHNENTLEKMDLSYFFTMLSIEKNISILFNLLNYNFEEKPCLINLISKLYKNVNNILFFKISYLILVRHVILKIDPIFADEYLKDFLIHLKTDSSNFAKILFTQVEKKSKKSCLDDESIDKKYFNEYREDKENYHELSSDSFDIKKIIDNDY